MNELRDFKECAEHAARVLDDLEVLMDTGAVSDDEATAISNDIADALGEAAKEFGIDITDGEADAPPRLD